MTERPWLAAFTIAVLAATACAGTAAPSGSLPSPADVTSAPRSATEPSPSPLPAGGGATAGPSPSARPAPTPPAAATGGGPLPVAAPPALRAEFSLKFIEAFAENAPPGTTGYRFGIGTAVVREGSNALQSRLPEGCRTRPPPNCTWQIVFTRSPPVAELFLPDDFPLGEYVFGFTLQDGRSADTIFSTSVVAALPRYDNCPQPPPPSSEGRVVPVGALVLATDFAAICSGRHGASDASIAAGLSEVLIATNDAFALHDKAGRVIDRIPSLDMFSSVMSSAGYGWGDPRALFDRGSRRYFLAFTLSRVVPGRGACECDLRWLLAVSRTTAPTSLRPSDWYLYAFDGTLEGGKPTANSSGDFLVLAADANNLVLHANMAGSPAAESSFTKLWVFDKAKLLRGDPVNGPDREFVDVRDPLTGGSLIRLLPAAMNDDPGRVFLAGRSTSGCSLVVAAVSGSAERAELTLRGVPITGVCPWPPHSPQLGGGTPIWSVGDVMGQPSYAGGRIWLTHGVAAQVATPGAVGGIRVVELDVSRWPAVPSVATDTTFAEKGVWYSFPAVAANARGDVAIVATRSSFTEYGSVWYTGRLGADPPRTLRPPVLLKRGEANLNQVIRASQPASGTFNKFADFSGAALDPQDGTAWLIGTYVANVCAWGTWIGHVDWTTAARETGTTAPTAATLTGPACPTLKRDLFTLQFNGIDAGRSSLSAGTRAYLFGYSGADLADPRLAPTVTSPVSNARWEVNGPATLVLFVGADELSPGSYQLRMRLTDGRETGASFTVMPP